MNIVVTGANGYLAKNLISKFSHHTVILLTRENNTEDFLLNSNPDVIIHTICSYGRKGESISEIYESNLLTGIKLLGIIQKLNKKVTFINCGTSLEKYTNLYSISKSQLVEFGKFISNDTLQFINMNLEHFYGPNATNNFLTFVINECLQNNNIPLTIGTQRRDFIFIEDVLDAFSVIVENRENVDTFQNIDVGTGIATAVKDVVIRIKEITNSTSNLNFGAIPLRENEVDIMKADINNLKKLGWQPKITLEEGLRKILKDIS